MALLYRDTYCQGGALLIGICTKAFSKQSSIVLYRFWMGNVGNSRNYLLKCVKWTAMIEMCVKSRESACG